MEALPPIGKKQDKIRTRIQEIQRRNESRLHQEAIAAIEKASMATAEVTIEENCLEIDGVRLQKNKKS